MTAAGGSSNGGSGGVASSGSPSPVGCSAHGWTLSFNDEFNGSSLDKSKWNDLWGKAGETHWNTIGWSWEYMTEDAVTVSNGSLHIRQWENPNVIVNGGPRTESGIVNTGGLFSQQYGCFEARLKTSGRQGTLNAFWMVTESGQWPPEFDIEEILGRDVNTVNMTEHYDSDNKSSAGTYTGPDFSADFHVFSGEWNADVLIWYVDGVERFRTANHMNSPMYPQLNIHVGNSWAGYPDVSNTTPSYMDVDWVRVWK